MAWVSSGSIAVSRGSLVSWPGARMGEGGWCPDKATSPVIAGGATSRADKYIGQLETIVGRKLMRIVTEMELSNMGS